MGRSSVAREKTPRRTSSLDHVCCIPTNLAVMVIIAVFPPMKSVFQRFLASCGSEGIDPRVAGLESYKLGLRESTADGGAERVQSSLLLWWRAFLILDVPIIKFFLVQLTSLVMLLMTRRSRRASTMMAPRDVSELQSITRRWSARDMISSNISLKKLSPGARYTGAHLVLPPQGTAQMAT